ncbi:hypothetical protein JAO78_005155 [Alishewanella sp. 16-MA]|uniref:Uncharacterized protein n=1 Tax=Alishewanella maricola TaxID=2795740 RepID=A0ABS8C1I9_9ALTE|nr:hypothetical protein [Alishewanella maricola]MCB5226199.1 hypothetical protein [Alishewanella maricola]
MWAKYRNKYGPLSPNQRDERIAAAQMLQLSALHGGKRQLDDFMLWTKPEERELSLDEAMQQWV